MKKTSFRMAIFLVTALLAGCGGSQPNAVLLMPQQINEPVLSEVTSTYEQQFEKVNNCDGTNPTYVIGYKTIESQSATFEVVAEAGGLVTGTPVPEVLQVQLEAKIAASLSKQFGITVEKSHEIFLENPQGKYLEQVITWEVTKVKGLIDVIYEDGIAEVAFNKIANVELYDRRSTELGCDTQAIELTPIFPTSEVIASPVAVSTTPPPISAVQNIESLSINGALYSLPNTGRSPFCVAQEIHTQGKNKVNYEINVPEGWVMAWDSYKAYWPGNQYLDSGLLVIVGPWQGEITIDTGGSCSGPIEWIDWIIENRMNDYPVPSRPIYYLGDRP